MFERKLPCGFLFSKSLELQRNDRCIGIHCERLAQHCTDMGISKRKSRRQKHRVRGQQKPLQSLEQRRVRLLLSEIVLQVVRVYEFGTICTSAPHHSSIVTFPAQ